MFIAMTNSDFLYRVKPKPILISSRRQVRGQEIKKTFAANLRSYWRILQSGALLTIGSSTHFLDFFMTPRSFCTWKMSRPWSSLQAEIWSSFGMITICLRDRVSLRKPSPLETGNTSIQEPLVMGLRWNLSFEYLKNCSSLTSFTGVWRRW